MANFYQTHAMKAYFEKYHMVRTHIARIFNQTNNLTVERWLTGKDLYLGSLLTFCNSYQLDLLSFINRDGQPFRSTLKDIEDLEAQGYSVRDLMEKHGLQTTSADKVRTLSDDFIGQDEAPAKPTKVAEEEEKTPMQETALLPGDLLDRFIAVQTQAFEHERLALESLRKDMQNIIDRQDASIEELQKENKRLKAELEKAKKSNIRLPYIADDGGAS